MKFKVFFSVLLSAFLFLIPFSVIAQEFEDDPDRTSEAVPIDGGLSLLIAAGVGYGVKKAVQDKRRIKND